MIFTVVFAGEEYAERSDNLVIHLCAGIRVECECHVDRNPETRAVGQGLRTAHEVVDPVCTRHVVVAIVVGTLFWIVDLFGESGPLKPVPCPFDISRISAYGGERRQSRNV